MFIFIGLIITTIGAFLVIKTEWFLNNFGRIAWFEDKLSSEGGSRLGYKLVGIIFLFVGIIVMTGSGNSLMAWVVSPLMKFSGPK